MSLGKSNTTTNDLATGHKASRFLNQEVVQANKLQMSFLCENRMHE